MREIAEHVRRSRASVRRVIGVRRPGPKPEIAALCRRLIVRVARTGR